MTTTWTTTAAAAITTATVVLLLIATVSAQNNASLPAPPPVLASSVSAGCSAALMNLSDCLTFVEEGSNMTAPAKSCCPELAGVVDRNLTCLCEVLSKADSFRVKVDYNRMLQLPSACDIITPPASLCSDVGVPVAVPSAGSKSNPTDVSGAAASPAASTPFKSGSGWMGGVGASAPTVHLGLITPLLLLTLYF